MVSHFIALGRNTSNLLDTHNLLVSPFANNCPKVFLLTLFGSYSIYQFFLNFPLKKFRRLVNCKFDFSSGLLSGCFACTRNLSHPIGMFRRNKKTRRTYLNLTVHIECTYILSHPIAPIRMFRRNKKTRY
jgi:hypothetical protein